MNAAETGQRQNDYQGGKGTMGVIDNGYVKDWRHWYSAVLILLLSGLLAGCPDKAGSSKNTDPVTEKPGGNDDATTVPENENDTTPATGGDASTPAFLTSPQITLAPDATTPLAALLTVSTNMDTRISVLLSTDDQRWTINFSSLGSTHSLPVAGLRPGKTFTAEVTAISPSGGQATAEQALTFTTDPLPAGFPTISVNSDPSSMEPGYTLFNVLARGSANVAFGELLVVVNARGEVVWYHRNPRFLDVRQLANGNILAQRGSSLVELDLLGNTVHDWMPSGNQNFVGPDVTVNTAIFHHEVFPMENGNFIGLSIEARNFDNYPTSYDNSTAAATSLVAGDLIVEFQPDGTIVNEWHLLDMLDPYRIGYGSMGGYWNFFYGADSGSRDWSHANAVVHNAKDDSILVSLRHQDALVKFDRKTGALIWILGPHENWDMTRFGQYLLTPVSNQQYFHSFHPHAPEILPNGNILVYDNGNWRASPPDPWLTDNENFSRAVEYAVNEETMEVELVWEYGELASTTYFSGFLGDADYLAGTGNVLITHGSLLAASGKMSAQIVEVTRADPPVEVFNMTVNDISADATSGWRVYRSERIGSLYSADVATVDELTP